MTSVHHTDPRLQGLTVLERGWLSSNNVLLHGTLDNPGAVLVDSAHVTHAAQTQALVQHALQGRPWGADVLREVVNTHLHSDHCGGNATLQRAHGCPLRIPTGSFEAARAWDEDRLSYRATGQRCEPFVPTAQITPGEQLHVGNRQWQALAAPGHDPESLVFFDAQQGVLISADALWQNGFGVVFPELEGEQAFDDVARVLDLIENLDARLVIPGHGGAFTDVSDALARARKRLAGFRADPRRHSWHAAKVLLKFHLLEEVQQEQEDLLQWFCASPLVGRVWQGLGRPEGSLRAFGHRAVTELTASGAAALRGGVLYNV
jgi:glyoxylase-like metal-dependent hydrolase (beta-lactamase superfamily II)